MTATSGDKSQRAEHPETDQCGFDRSESIAQDCYVCLCGWADHDTPNPSPVPPTPAPGEPSELVKRIRAYSYADADAVSQLERELAHMNEVYASACVRVVRMGVPAFGTLDEGLDKLAAQRSAINAPTHRYVYVYPNGDYTAGLSEAAALFTDVAYNIRMRPGRAIVIDGVTIYEGINVGRDVIDNAITSADGQAPSTERKTTDG